VGSWSVEMETDPRKDSAVPPEAGKIEAAETGKRLESPGRLSPDRLGRKKLEYSTAIPVGVAVFVRVHLVESVGLASLTESVGLASLAESVGLVSLTGSAGFGFSPYLFWSQTWT